MKKRYIYIALALIAAVALGFFFRNPSIASRNLSVADEKSIVSQNVLGIYDDPVEVTKVYYQDQLLGVIQDSSVLAQVKDKAYEQYYKTDFPNANIQFDNDIYFYNEKTYLRYDNKDKEICDYLLKNDLFLVDAYKINIGDKDVIYVKSEDDFKAALREFALIFISEDVFVKLENREAIVSLTTIGEQEVNISIEERLVSTPSGASASEIFKNKDEILMYLCYGKDYELEYYTVQEFDNVNSVAYYHALTEEQLIMINESLHSADQILKPGTQLNVTYFNSPITVVVEKERYVQEIIYRDDTIYKIDESLMAGMSEVVTPGKDGKRNTLYQDIYVNGILTSYKQKYTVVVETPVTEVIRIGTSTTHIDTGELNFRFPIDNCRLYSGYEFSTYKPRAGHKGVDFINIYQPYGKVYACENGTVVLNAWYNDTGWMYAIQHGPFRFRYMHMRTRGWIQAGEQVVRGEYIGDIGMTGLAYGPHVHLDIKVEGKFVDPCLVLNCDLCI